MPKMPKFDPSKPHTVRSSLTPSDKVFCQDGVWFNTKGEFVENHVKTVPRKHVKAKPVGEVRNEAVERATALLGDLGIDPGVQAQRENAAAAEAENLSDDA